MESKQLFEKQGNSHNPFFPIVRLEDIIDKISDKSIQWILNTYNHIYVEYSESTAITRNKVPALLRRTGLWITYNVNKEIITEYYKGDNKDVQNYLQWTMDDNWERFDKIKHLDGSIEYQHLSEALKELMGNGNTITNFPDDEDLEVRKGVLKFKDKEYNIDNFSGLGRVILRKNFQIIDNEVKNVLTQSMINKSNTIYIIQYDYDLSGQEITIPEDCVLDFQGGSLSNGIVINLGWINVTNNNAIFKNIEFINPKEQYIKLSYFKSDSFKQSFEQAAKFKHVDCSGEWYINEPINISNDIEVFNGRFISKSGIRNIEITTDYIEESLSNAIYKGATSINANIEGDYDFCYIFSDDLYYNHIQIGTESSRKSKRGELMKILSIEDGIINFDSRDGLILDYETNIRIRLFNSIKVNIHDVDFDGEKTYDLSDDNEKLGAHIVISNAKASINNCSFVGLSAGVILNNCYLSFVTNSNFEYVMWGASFEDASAFCSVTNCSFSRVKHAWTSLAENSVTKYSLITGNNVKDAHYAFMSHAGAFGTTISNNTISDSRGGIGSMSPNTVIENNNLQRIGSESRNRGIVLIEGGVVNPIVCGNTISFRDMSQSAIICNDANDNDFYFIKPEYCVFNNNKVFNAVGGGGISASFENYSKGNVKITCNGNTFYKTGYSSMELCANTIIANNNNIFDVTKGYASVFKGVGEGSFLSICNNVFLNNPTQNYIEVIDFNIVKSEGNYNKFDKHIEYNSCRTVLSENFDLIKFTENKYIKIGNFDSQYRYASIIVSTSNPSSRYGTFCVINIAGRPNERPIIGATMLNHNDYVDFEIYSDLNGDVYIGKLKVCYISWLTKDSVYTNIYNGLDEIPDSAVKININDSILLEKGGSTNNRPTSPPFGYNYYDETLKASIYWVATKWVKYDGTDVDAKYVGAFEIKPSNPSIGFSYFCTDRQTTEGASNGIMIYHKGNDVWVDALGRVME